MAWHGIAGIRTVGFKTVGGDVDVGVRRGAGVDFEKGRGWLG